MNEHAVRKIRGAVPTDVTSRVGPAGDQRWLAHTTCMHSAALKVAGEVDITCVVCGEDVDAEERHPPYEEVRTMLGVKSRNAGGKPDPLEWMTASVEAAISAWQCQQCARWQCNRCVCAALTSGRGGRVPDHINCGGRFAPPT